MSAILRKGDKIWVRGPFGTRHYGIYIGLYEVGPGVWGHAVVHNSKKQRGVVIDTLERFSCRERVAIASRAVPGYEDVVVNRALSWYGSKYDLIGFNCEHMVNLAQQGEHKSQQLRNAAGLTAVLSTLVGMAWVAHQPEYDPVVDRYRDKRGRFARR